MIDLEPEIFTSESFHPFLHFLLGVVLVCSALPHPPLMFALPYLPYIPYIDNQAILDLKSEI